MGKYIFENLIRPHNPVSPCGEYRIEYSQRLIIRKKEGDHQVYSSGGGPVAWSLRAGLAGLCNDLESGGIKLL